VPERRQVADALAHCELERRHGGELAAEAENLNRLVADPIDDAVAFAEPIVERHRSRSRSRRKSWIHSRRCCGNCADACALDCRQFSPVRRRELRIGHPLGEFCRGPILAAAACRRVQSEAVRACGIQRGDCED
jgi:hypothetical protein